MALGSFRMKFHLSWLPTTFILTLTTVVLMPTVCHSYDSNLGLSDLCKARCDNHRIPGFRGAYQFDCKKEYSDDWSQKECMKDCQHCPNSICVDNAYERNIFNCPETDIEGQCKMNCDLNREKGSLDAYLLKCNQAYHQSYDNIQECRNQCKDCPKWVCDPTEDKNMYNCPTGWYDGDCKRDCEYHRKTRFYGTKDKFTFHCTDFQDLGTDKVENCYKACFNCPLMICNEFDDRNEYTCPPNPNSVPQPTPPPPPPTEKTYYGRCKEFCNRFRNGGTDEYQLGCNTFSTAEEQKECQAICRGCPDICNSHNTYYYNCPAATDHFDHKTAFIICLVLLIFVTIGLIMTVILLMCRSNNPGVIAQPTVVAPVNPQFQQSTYQTTGYTVAPQTTQSVPPSYAYQTQATSPTVPA